MKKEGNVCEFIAERNAELHASFMEVLRTRTDLALKEMFGVAALMPASRFWVSEERAAFVLSAMLRGEPLPEMLPKRLEMYLEMKKRAEKLLNRFPDMPMTRVAAAVVYSEAPEFYLEPKSARAIIYRIRKSKKAERRGYDSTRFVG